MVWLATAGPHKIVPVITIELAVIGSTLTSSLLKLAWKAAWLDNVPFKARQFALVKKGYVGSSETVMSTQAKVPTARLEGVVPFALMLFNVELMDDVRVEIVLLAIAS